MARRRDESVRTDLGVPPPELCSMRGVPGFRDPVEAVPAWVSAGDAEQWRMNGAFGRWLQARRAWCEDNGADYAQTFRPEWLRGPGGAA
jgi:hypothetical protein